MPQLSFLLTIKALVKETQDTITLVFEPSPHLLHYQPGQFITLILPIGREILHRSYSLCTSPYTDTFPAITIKCIPGGRASNYLNNALKVGDRLEAFPATGNFLLPQDVARSYKGVFIAGGSGIAPIFSMIKALLYKEEHSKVLLIYANRDEKSIIYAKTLQKLKAKHPSRMQITHVLSRPSNPCKSASNRLTAPILKQLLGTSISEDNAHYFLCGPEGLMDLAYTTLVDSGVASTHIHKEKFTTPQTQQQVAPLPAKLTIHYEGEKYVYEMEAGQSVLDVALENGIDIPFSCSSGICNTCRAKCLKGKVDMLEDEGLTQEERDQGYVLTCVAYPTTEEVVIEVE